MGAAAQPAAGVPSPGAQPVAAAPMADNVASALCYVLGLITGIVFLVMEPYSKSRAVRFHAFQSIFMNVAVIAVEIVFSILFNIILRIFWTAGGFGGYGLFGSLMSLVWLVFWLACVGLWLYLIISAYQGKTVVLPIIGPLAQKQAGA
jgi:uncharacterized membrane protein